jgi:tetratricopeptide (TPR) repeat protein
MTASSNLANLPTEPNALLEAIHFCMAGSEYRQAHGYCLEALKEATSDTPAPFLEDVLEAMQACQKELQEFVEDLPEMLEYLRSHPDDGDTHFCLGFTYDCLGDNERAIAEYRKALWNFDSMEPEQQRDCLNSIGWYYYRRGEALEALQWFAGACWFEDPSDPAPYKLAMENLFLVYAELGMTEHAQHLATEYIDLYGPIPTTEARALQRLGVDADAIWLKRKMGIV